MRLPQLNYCGAICALLIVFDTGPARAQTVETVGSRALGMGGAFVAVANDSTATWWNPGALAAGPFLDLSLGRAATEQVGELPAGRDGATWFALGTPALGFSYYRFRISQIAPVRGAAAPFFDPTVTESGSREDRGAGVPVHSLSGSQLGITLVQTLIPGVHAGATLKYVRGTLRSGLDDPLRSAGDLLDRADELEDGEGDGAFGVDLGLIGVAGPVRAGLLVRNLRDFELENEAGVVRFGRQFRVGVAFEAEKAGGPPLTVALDADARTMGTATGDRRNVAIGAEQWFLSQRLAVRGGARFNTVGAKERAATGGVSVAVRAGLFLDAHVVRGGAEDDRGWGLAARVSF